MKPLLPILALMLAACGGACGTAMAQTHPSQQPALTPDTVFPRCTAEQLAAGGFPDHLHGYWWPGWQVLTDGEGATYGPGAFCDRKTVLPRPQLVIGEGEKRWGHFVVRHNPAYADCDMLPLLELLDWAGRSAEQLLGLTSPDTLTVISSDNISSYRQLTGQDVWRLYALQNDTCIIEPLGTLQARTLDGHAAFMLVFDWLLRENVGQNLPPWLHRGLVEYLGENGVHLVNYMVQFRQQENLLLAPPLIDAFLAQGPDPDRARDREMYRRACYSSFLMVWRLVEEEGGLQAMRRFLDLVKDGVHAEAAAGMVYGATITELALKLNPAQLEEPIGQATQSRKPQIQP
jgi:hypothetical protein